MEIFDKQIFGNDAEQWLKLCKEQKKEWILKYTSQNDVEKIKEFIDNAKISKDCKCLDCGKNGNISKEISTETKTITNVDNVRENGRTGTKKGRTNAKRP